MSTFTEGMRVWFDSPEGRITGTVIRVNKKTVSVDLGRGGEYYRVPPQLLHPVDEPMAQAMRSVKVARLIVSQDQLFDCVQERPDAEAFARLDRIRAVIENPGGCLIIVADRDDVLGGQVQRLLPWVGAWLDAGVGTAFQLIGALAPWQVKGGQPVRGRKQIEAAVYIANHAIAFTHMLGGTDLSHVDSFMGIVGINALPDGFFDGADAVADQMDPAGRRRGQA